MGININSFSKDKNSVEVTENLPTAVQEENFDIMEYTNNKKNELRKSKEVEALTSLIEVENPDTIKKANNAIEMMFQKYETLGGEVEKIQIELEQYERDIALSNKQIGAMLNENFEFYNELQKYIVAGEMAIEEMDNEILPFFKQKSETSGDQMDVVNYQELLKVYDMLNQRVYDLRIAENIAIQTIPMLRGMQHNNYGLIRKINSAFVVTLPVFKQCLSQAILLKKQELQAKSLKALDDKTNELLLRNAQNVSTQSAQIARMAGTSSVQIETLEKMYNTIKSGIDETMRIEENNRALIKDNTKRLEELNTTIIYNK